MQQSVQTIRVKHDPISVHMQSAPRSGTIADCLTLTGAASSCSFFFCFFPFWPFPWPPLALGGSLDVVAVAKLQDALCFFVDPQEQSLVLDFS